MKKKDLDKLKAEIEQLEQENGELKQDLQRTRADFENYRKNVELEKERVKMVVEHKMALELLPVLDDLDLALAHQPEELKDNKWAQGVANLDKKLTSSLTKIGITKIEANVGTEFDPELHEAITMEEGDGKKEVISAELRAGYKYNDQVIRPSMVKVRH